MLDRGAVPDTFGPNVDFAMLIKIYKAAADGERKYSAAEVASVEVVPLAGQPDPDRICTARSNPGRFALGLFQNRARKEQESIPKRDVTRRTTTQASTARQQD
jgi:hypothetical protein